MDYRPNEIFSIFLAAKCSYTFNVFTQKGGFIKYLDKSLIFGTTKIFNMTKTRRLPAEFECFQRIVIYKYVYNLAMTFIGFESFQAMII